MTRTVDSLVRATVLGVFEVLKEAKLEHVIPASTTPNVTISTPHFATKREGIDPEEAIPAVVDDTLRSIFDEEFH